MIGRFLKKRVRRQEIEEELAAHIAIESQLLQERGVVPEEADSLARRSFGNQLLIAEEAREAWICSWLDRLKQDLTYAVRILRVDSTFAYGVILSIALGVGAGTAVYSVADSVFFRPLPYVHPDRLVSVAVTFPEFKMEFVPAPDYVAWRRDNRVFENLAAVLARGVVPLLLNGDHAEVVQSLRVSGNFLHTLGVEPLLGRDFSPQEELPKGQRTVLLTHRLWQRHFHSNPAIVGRDIKLDGETYGVIGVLPRSFVFPNEFTPDLLVTLPSNGDPKFGFLSVYGRLKPNVTLAQARSEIERLFALTKAAESSAYQTWNHLVVETLQQHRIGDVRHLLTILVGFVTCLLLITCANVANLLLARWAARSGELALRSAIGAGRTRLARQLLTEAALLALPGCVLAALLAFILLRGFVHYAPNELPRMSEVAFDGRVLLIGTCLSILTTLVFGCWPALRAGRVNIQHVLQQSERSGVTAGFGVARHSLITTEMALCLVLLSGAALLIQTLWHLKTDSLGFEPEHSFSISIPVMGTKLESAAGGQNRSRNLLDSIRNIPNIEAVAQSECTPLSGGGMLGFFSRADHPAKELRHLSDAVRVCGITPSFKEAVGLRILQGRFFTDADDNHPQTLAVINETAARVYFPGENVIGKQILGGIRSPDGRQSAWKTIVGVVADSASA